MASLINKLKSSVSEVLSGNPLAGDYDIQDQSIGSAGPGLVWKIFRAKKKTSKEPAAVFVFEKKSIEKLNKAEKTEALTLLKKGIQQLTKLRHPKILSVLHPLEENRECLAFATEPVYMSLANVLGDERNVGHYVKSDTLDDVEIKYGLLQVLEALGFLHGDVNLIHANIHPSSIVLNSKRVWKLSGFDFSISKSGASSPEQVGWKSGQSELLQPSLDFMAPESVIHSSSDTRSDMYSLGILLHAIYNQGKPVYQSHNSYANCRRHITEINPLKQLVLRNIPDGLRDSLKQLLNPESSNRPDSKALLKIGYFDDVSVMTLVYLDTLVQRDNLQKSQYFKSLPSILRQLPLNISLHRILPVLFGECSNVDMVPFVLQNILAVVDRSSKQQYNEYIFARLAPLMRLTQPIQIPLMFLKNMSLLLNKTNDRDTKYHILPMILRAIDVDNAAMQELCLSILPTFSHLIEKESMKTAVVPRIKRLCLSTQYSNMKVKCLLSIGKMMNHMDKWFVLDDILPFLSQIQSKDAAVLMTTLGIYKTAFTHKSLGIPREQIATKALPFLLPLSVDHSLSKQQSYMSVIKDMLAVLEQEQTKKLDEQNEKESNETTRSLNLEDNTADDMMMAGFLKEAGLGSSSDGNTKAVTPKPIMSAPVPSLNQPKDLTSSLAASPMTIGQATPNSQHSNLAPPIPTANTANSSARLYDDKLNSGWSSTIQQSNTGWSEPVSSTNSIHKSSASGINWNMSAPSATNISQPTNSWSTPPATNNWSLTAPPPGNIPSWSVPTKKLENAQGNLHGFPRSGLIQNTSAPNHNDGFSQNLTSSGWPAGGTSQSRPDNQMNKVSGVCGINWSMNTGTMMPMNSQSGLLGGSLSQSNWTQQTTGNSLPNVSAIHQQHQSKQLSQKDLDDLLG